MACLMGHEQRQVFKYFLDKNHIWDGYKMQVGFNLTHINEYIWPYVQRRYLYGKDHISLDSVYWALDLTHTSEALYWFYIKNLHGDNQLIQANSLVVADTTINLEDITTPCCLISFSDDKLSPPTHIKRLAKHLASECTIIEAPGSHVGGLLSPPSQKVTDQTLKKEAKQTASWWPMWLNHLSLTQHSTSIQIDQVYLKSPFIKEAPGDYVQNE